MGIVGAIYRSQLRIRSELANFFNQNEKIGPRRRRKFLIDDAVAVGSSAALPVGYRADIDKESLCREYILGHGKLPQPRKLRFLDVGGRDGELSYLLGNIGPLNFDAAAYQANKRSFDDMYEYFGVDLHPSGSNVLHGDICDPAFLETYRDSLGSFDVVYSNNVFEHFERPWVAAEILLGLLKTGGICITVVPFAQRYHESPGDYFRYTHMGIPALFKAAGPVRVLEAGYDIRARRYDWQGLGAANDAVPTDRYGAWRETWFAVSIIEKLPVA